MKVEENMTRLINENKYYNYKYNIDYDPMEDF